MWSSLFCYSVAVSTSLSTATQWSAWMLRGVGLPLHRQASNVSLCLHWVVGRFGVDERLRDMFAQPGTSVWALFKRAAGESGKTSPFSLGLTRIGTGGKRRNRDAGSLSDWRSWKGWQSGHLWSPPTPTPGSLVYGYRGLCKIHGISGNLETLHNSEIVYMTIKTVSNQVIDINGSDVFFAPFIGFF